MKSINRRSLMQGGLSLAALGSFPGIAFADGRLVVTDPGGSTQQAMVKAFYKPFERATGVTVTFAARPNQAMGQLKSMVLANNVEWDVTYLSDYLVNLALADDLLDEIDTSKMDPKLLAEMLPGTVSPYLVGGAIYGTVFSYSTKLWPDPTLAPKNWADFWDMKRFPGRRAMIGGGYGPIEQALLADGVPRDKLYPLDLDRAFAKLDEIRPHVTVWTTASAQQNQLLVNNEVDLLHGFANRIVSAMDDGARVTIQWRDGSTTHEGWVIPKGAKNRELVLKFIEFVLDAKRQAEGVTASAPTNSLATNFLAPERARMLPTYPENFAQAFATDAKWLAANQAMLNQRWTQWRARRT
jgi:putative spermidine/putrescine transport system substrate-binding protein